MEKLIFQKPILVFLIVFAMILTGCKTAEKALNSGNYDKAFSISVKKLRKNPHKQKYVQIIEPAFKKSRASKEARIRFLKKEGQPDRWDEVFNLYSILKRQQKQANALPKLYNEAEQRNVNFPYKNYDSEIIQAKKNAAEYFYAHAKELLKRGGKTNARKAYDELQNIKSFYADYKDVNALMQQALIAGTNYVNFRMINKTRVLLPRDFERELKKISLEDLNRRWLTYHTKEIKNQYYDYSILVLLKVIDVTPEAVKEVHYTDEKKVNDGFDYLLDAKGNVQKDTAGNDIKIPKTKIIKCKLIESQQYKSARISGSVDYFDNNSKQLIKTFPITSDAIFEHFAARTASGDLNALSKASKEKLKRKPVPFPTDFDLLLQSGATLKGMIKDIIWSNKNVFK